jgi:hypothetical protein
MVMKITAGEGTWFTWLLLGAELGFVIFWIVKINDGGK